MFVVERCGVPKNKNLVCVCVCVCYVLQLLISDSNLRLYNQLWWGQCRGYKISNGCSWLSCQVQVGRGEMRRDALSTSSITSWPVQARFFMKFLVPHRMSHSHRLFQLGSYGRHPAVGQLPSSFQLPSNFQRTCLWQYLRWMWCTCNAAD